MSLSGAACAACTMSSIDLNGLSLATATKKSVCSVGRIGSKSGPAFVLKMLRRKKPSRLPATTSAFHAKTSSRKETRQRERAGHLTLAASAVHGRPELLQPLFDCPQIITNLF